MTEEAEVKPRFVANGLRGRSNVRLNAACRIVNGLLSENGHCYQVGSSLSSKDFHDVDVRYIMSDEDWKKMFGELDPHQPKFNGLWSLLCFVISDWLSRETDLDVDFQIQQASRANEDFKGPRSSLGINCDYYPGGG